jgi:NADPH:quinone reductase-like Zn-dependent oxidoreductase
MKAMRYHSYGADHLIDYTATQLPRAAAGQQFDVVLNLVRAGTEETAALAGLAADGGAFVSTTFPDLDDAGRRVRVMSAFARSDATQLANLVARADAGELKIDVAGRRPLTDLAAVHDEAVAGRLPGKIIVIP